MVQKVLRLPAVLDATGYSKATLYSKIKEGIFPAGVRLDPNGRTVVWFEDDVEAFQNAGRTRVAEVA